MTDCDATDLLLVGGTGVIAPAVAEQLDAC